MLSVIAVMALAAAPLTANDVIDALGEKGCPRVFDMLTPAFQKAVPSEKWPAFCQSFGALSEVKAAGIDNTFTAVGSHGPITISLAFTSDHKVNGLIVKPGAVISAAVTNIVKALAEPGCPRVFPMLSDAFQKAAPAKDWPGFCDSVGPMTSLKKMPSTAGWDTYDASTSRGRVTMKLALDPDGKIAGLSIAAAKNPQAAPRTLADVVTGIVKNRGLPALGALAFKDGAVTNLEVAGVRKLGDPAPVTKDDVWHLGSDTKAMTAMLAGMMVDAKKWKWTSTVAELFPKAKMHPDFKKVTLQQLLTHRAGLPANFADAMWKKEPALLEGAMADRKVLVDATLLLPPSPPGNYAYSNVGYVMVGAALEQAAKKPWHVLMQEKIFTPLKMTTCTFGARALPTTLTQPWPHQWNNVAAIPVTTVDRFDNPAALGPAGTVKCSLGDWAKFIELFAMSDAHGLVTPETLLHLTTPEGTYACGWIVESMPWSATPVLAHTGSNGVNFATVLVSPGSHRAFLAATNLGEETIANDAVNEALSFMAQP